MRRLWLNSAYRTPHLKSEPPSRRLLQGSWGASFRFCARIGTMNQIGTPLPALSPQGGERVAEGRERGGSWGASFRFCARIGTMNRCASQRRGLDRGSATGSLLGSWAGEYVRHISLVVVSSCVDPSHPT